MVSLEFLIQLEKIRREVEQISKHFGTMFGTFLGQFSEHFQIIWVAFWGFGVIPPKISEKGMKKVPLGALSCPTWRQDGTKMAILELKIANLRPLWEVSRIIFAILGAKSQIAKNL